MKSWVVLLSIKVAVITASSSVILIFIRSVLSGTVSVCGTAVAVLVGVGGTAVGVTVGSEFVGVEGIAVGVAGTVVGVTVGGGFADAETVTVGVGGTAVGEDVGVGAGPQAARKTAAATSTVICR